ncbi:MULTISPECIES: hypothetical protein [Paraburkholderia]|uniref:hypothetical protein n=1 Tax=Paraburkholderia TaxID=1822464 RepID=UPI003218C545
MQLYHYTSATMAESIFHEGLQPSTLTRGDGTIMKGVLWLTTDTDVNGHGLLTGKERLTESQRRFLEKIQGGPLKNEVMVDKTAIRIQVDIEDDDPMLHSFVDWSKKNERPGYARIMGLSALYDLKALTDAELKRAYKHAKTKEATWKLYFSSVPPMKISDVSALAGTQFVPYDFERNGRGPLRENGLTIVSADSLRRLRDFLPPLHRFDLPKAFCICTEASDRPFVVIRGGGFQFSVGLRSGELREGQATVAILAAAKAWVGERQAELEACWEDATETYFRFYPEKRLTRESHGS